MATREEGYWSTKPGELERMDCHVCGAACEITRDVFGPTGFAEAMAKRGHWHDRVDCPHSGRVWHNSVYRLKNKIAATPSKRLAALMKLDVDDILREHGLLKE